MDLLQLMRKARDLVGTPLGYGHWSLFGLWFGSSPSCRTQ